MGIFYSISGFPLRKTFSLTFMHLGACRLPLSAVYGRGRYWRESMGVSLPCRAFVPLKNVPLRR